MSISRNTFDPAKNYKRVRYHQDRDLLDSELNEQQDITISERKKLADLLFREGAIIGGLVPQVAKGTDYVDGGWFGQSGYPAAAEYYYVVTALSASASPASAKWAETVSLPDRPMPRAFCSKARMPRPGHL